MECSEKIIEEKFIKQRGESVASISVFKEPATESSNLEARIINDLEVLNLIKAGHYSSVYTGIAWGTTTVACKLLKRKDLETLHSEVAILM